MGCSLMIIISGYILEVHFDKKLKSIPKFEGIMISPAEDFFLLSWVSSQWKSQQMCHLSNGPQIYMKCNSLDIWSQIETFRHDFTSSYLILLGIMGNVCRKSPAKSSNSIQQTIIPSYIF